MIQPLEKSRYDKYPLEFSYETTEYFDILLNTSPDYFEFKFERKTFTEPVKKKFTDHLYASHCENPQAFGYFIEKELAGVIEIDIEAWSKRAVITECIVFESFRKQKIGTKLIDFAKVYAKEQGARAIILETQTCNTPAIAFYRHNGFDLIGVDTVCYSNQDIESKEVRIELGLKL